MTLPTSYFITYTWVHSATSKLLMLCDIALIIQLFFYLTTIFFFYFFMLYKKDIIFKILATGSGSSPRVQNQGTKKCKKEISCDEI